MPLDVLEQFWTLGNCDYQQSFVSQYLVFFYFSHYAIALFIFIVGLIYARELYLLLLSLGITLNYYLNVLLQWAFLRAVPVPTCAAGAGFCIDPTSTFNACGVAPFPSPPPAGATCGAPPLDACSPCVPCGMPALEPQLTAFTVASIGIFALQFRSTHIRLYHLALLLGFYTAVMYTHLFFGFNDTAQVLAGALVGVLMAVLWQMLIFAAAYPQFDRVLRWRIVRTLDYHDTFCRSYAPIEGESRPLANAAVADDDATLTYRPFLAS